MAVVNYCTVRDYRNFVSATGVALRIDDQPPDMLGDTIGYASDDMEEYLWTRYRLLLQGGGNSWIRRRCTERGVYYFCQRRMNAVPAVVASRFDATTKKLELIHAGRLNIPNAAETSPAIPYLSQGRIILTPLGTVPAIERSRSTGQAQGYARHDDPFDYAAALSWNW